LFSPKYFSGEISVLEKLHLHHPDIRIFVQSWSCFSKINLVLSFGAFMAQKSPLAPHQIIIIL
jgi:hypothetical protein